MAQYKVPQDVEADDKLLGPFSFRQFLYLVAAAVAGGAAFALYKLFPILVIIPIPFILLMLTLALPLKKDQPMETYLAAIVSFYTKPHKRIWEAGEPESTIIITAPKQVEEQRTKEFNGEEASHRLSFLAEIVDTEGYAIKASNQLDSSFTSEALDVDDIFDSPNNANINQALASDSENRHEALVAQMRQAIDNANSMQSSNASIGKFNQSQNTPIAPTTLNPQNAVNPNTVTSPQAAPTQKLEPIPTSAVYPIPNTSPIQAARLPQPGQVLSGITPTSPVPPVLPARPAPITDQIHYQGSTVVDDHGDAKNSALKANNPVIIRPDLDSIEYTQDRKGYSDNEKSNKHTNFVNIKASLNEEPKRSERQVEELKDLAHNKDFSIETIAKQANRIEKKKDDGEVYISLH